MVDPGELCGILQCCRDDDGIDNSNDVSIYIAVLMFVVSEVLPFMGVKANGVVHFLMNFVKK